MLYDIPIVFCAGQACEIYKNRDFLLRRVGRQIEVKVGVKVSKSR